MAIMPKDMCMDGGRDTNRPKITPIEAVGLVAAQQTHISEAGKTEKVFSLFSRRFKILTGTTVLIIMSLPLLETITNKHLGLALCQAFSL